LSPVHGGEKRRAGVCAPALSNCFIFGAAKRT
jgi:hypothetical protein